MMTPDLKMYALRLESTQIKALKAIKARDGIPESEQIRRAIDVWVKSRRASRRRQVKRR